MSVSKRTRFEVLRRDNHTCQYCGETAPNVVLHVDHVEPVALGGSDKPDNLVTACKDCNTGKSSIAPGSPLVESVGAKAAAYALGMVDKMTRLRADVQESTDYIEEFDQLWATWKLSATGEPIPLPADYELSLFRWSQMGVPIRVLEMAIPKAMNKPGLRGDAAEFTYMAGIVWGMVNEREIDYSLTADTCAVFTEQEANDREVNAYEKGWRTGGSVGASTGAGV